jgi:hypothetical protein
MGAMTSLGSASSKEFRYGLSHSTTTRRRVMVTRIIIFIRKTEMVIKKPRIIIMPDINSIYSNPTV